MLVDILIYNNFLFILSCYYLKCVVHLEYIFLHILYNFYKHLTVFMNITAQDLTVQYVYEHIRNLSILF